MATLGKWSGNIIVLVPGATFAAPNALFPTQDRNDGSAYTFTSSTSTLTLPSTALANGYLLVAAFEYECSANRLMPQGRIIQASGTGTFAGSPAGGFARNAADDRAYVRCWAFIDNPSASATFQFQWRRDVDANAIQSIRSEFQVIPLFYADIGLYSSALATALGGTVPNVVTGFTGTDGTNITIASSVISVTGDNKRYLVLGSQFFEGRGGRTQRWHGLDIDGVQEDAAKAYSYYRNTNNDESGDIFTWLFETVTATVTIEATCYRGDGITSGQGGADGDGSVPAVGDHSLVVMELNDNCEVFRCTGSTNQNIATPGPIDINISQVADVDFNDAASFVRATDFGMNAEVSMDAMLGANISAASQIVSANSRYTGFGEFTINGIESGDSFAGDFLRGNQSGADTFGWSANLLGFEALVLNEDIGISITELTGSQGGGGAVHIQVGWAGFWGVNLDTMAPAVGAVTYPGFKNRKTFKQMIMR